MIPAVQLLLNGAAPPLLSLHLALFGMAPFEIAVPPQDIGSLNSPVFVPPRKPSLLAQQLIEEDELMLMLVVSLIQR